MSELRDYLRILAPCRSPDEVPALIDEGAEEIYCGLVPDSWTREAYSVEDINKEPSTESSIQGYDDLARAVERATKHEVPVYLTLNARYYTLEQYDLLMDIARRSLDCGVAALIVADFGLLLKIAAMPEKPRIHVSKVAGCFNTEAARIYRDLGVARIILPEHWQIDEMTSLTRSLRELDLEVEGYIFNGGCKYTESFCGLFHTGDVAPTRFKWLFNALKSFYFNERLYGALRHLPVRVRDYLENSTMGARFNPGICTVGCEVSACGGTQGNSSQASPEFFQSKFFHQTNLCSLCFLPEMADSGQTSLKIMGRGFSIRKKTADIRLVKKAIDLMKQVPDREAFREQVKKLYRRETGFDCEECCYFCW
ncbi:MAG: U32 family peptidase [bacterium]|nr:U32 family peptidase [bacterium]